MSQQTSSPSAFVGDPSEEISKHDRFPPTTAGMTLVGFILVFGIFLRIHALDRQSVWGDEMATIATISTPRGQIIHRFAAYETHPPLYFLQLRLWRAMHLRSLVKLRANSALWGSLSLFLAYLAGKRYGGKPLGLLTMAFLALSPYHLAYSQEMRPYAMAVAISLAALLMLERRSWILLGFLWTAQLYTHYWGVFVVGAQALFAYWTLPSWDEKKRLLYALGASVGCFALWLPVLAVQWGVVDRFNTWVPSFSLAAPGKVFLAFSGILFNMASSVFYLPARVGVLAFIGLCFAGALGMGFRRGPRAAAIWLTVGLGIPWIASYWKPTIFVWYRYPIHMLPAFALMVCAGLLVVRSRALRIFLIFVCLGSQGWGDWTYFHRWQKANPKAVVAYVHRLRTPATLVVRPAAFGELFNFYDQGTTPVLDEEALDSPQKRGALKDRKFILMNFDVPSDPVGDAILADYPASSARYFPGTWHLGMTVYEFK